MDLKPAGFLVRSIAFVVDILLYVMTVFSIFFLITGELSTHWAISWMGQWIFTGYLTLVPLFWNGYVIGKRIFKIKVRRIDGKELTLKDMFLREVVGKFIVVYATWGLSNIVSTLMVLFRKDKRAIHDIIAGTYVS